ncbi:hypothetical protein [Anaerovorax sp. IOR16]|uniref:hypothetical protein n=1 Tax=Anaerovorax sp. IOR16 TaxID=2773458 RepID=UPI0019D29BCC|nr:hypothetical protein [Anaerovorax sp. IOR16]
MEKNIKFAELKKDLMQFTNSSENKINEIKKLIIDIYLSEMEELNDLNFEPDYECDEDERAYETAFNHGHAMGMWSLACDIGEILNLKLPLPDEVDFEC